MSWRALYRREKLAIAAFTAALSFCKYCHLQPELGESHYLCSELLVTASVTLVPLIRLDRKKPGFETCNNKADAP